MRALLILALVASVHAGSPTFRLRHPGRLRQSLHGPEPEADPGSADTTPQPAADGSTPAADPLAEALGSAKVQPTCKSLDWSPLMSSMQPVRPRR